MGVSSYIHIYIYIYLFCYVFVVFVAEEPPPPAESVSVLAGVPAQGFGCLEKGLAFSRFCGFVLGSGFRNPKP